MLVIDHLRSVKNPTVSVEIIPPKRGGSLAKIHKAIESIRHFNPPFIDVTSHAAEVMWEELPDGTYKRKVKRKSPGTFGLCAAIKYRYELEPVPHLLCGGFTREETKMPSSSSITSELKMCLPSGETKTNHRPLPSDRTENKYAADLVRQIAGMNSGQYIDGAMIDTAATNFCVGVAYYPEKHFSSPTSNLTWISSRKKRKQGRITGCHKCF